MRYRVSRALTALVSAVTLLAAGGAWASAAGASVSGGAVPGTPSPAASAHVAAGAPAAEILTIGSRVVHAGAAVWVSPAAPVIHAGQPYVPLAMLARALGARFRRNGRQVLLARGPYETLVVLGAPRLAAGARLLPVRVVPWVHAYALLLPAAPVAHALGAEVGWNRATGRLSLRYPVPQRIVCCPNGGGGTGSGGGQGGPPITVTRTFTYGWSGAPLSAQYGLTYPATATSTWIGCYGYCGAAKGGLVDGANQPGSGFAGLGTAALGFASADAQQGMGVDFTPLAADGSPLPAGLPVALHVNATVFPISLTMGLSGVGVSCAPTSLAWSAPGGVGQTDTLSNCLGSLAVSVPIPGSADDSALESALETFGENVAENFGPWCAENPGQCAQTGQLLTANGRQLAQAMGNWLQLAQDLGPLVGMDLKFYHPQDFTWDGIVPSGQAQDFTVTPQAVAQDDGAGVMINTPYFYTLISVTEQYAENQYAYTFPTAEVGQPLLGNALEQCRDGICLGVSAASVQVVAGTLPAGMAPAVQDGYAVLTGSPAAGSEGTYSFSLQLDGTDVYHCTLSVAPPLAMATTRTTMVWEEGATPVPGFNALPVVAAGGVGAYVWALQPGAAGEFPNLFVAYSPDGPPLLEVRSQTPPGVYPFQVEVYDDYTNQSSGTISVQVLPPLAVATTALPGASPYTPCDLALVAAGLPPYAWHIVSGTLPPGVQLASDGVLSGTPAGDDAGRTYAFTAGVSDAAGGSARRAFTIGVASAGTPSLSAQVADPQLGWWLRCATLPKVGRLCTWVDAGNSTTVTAQTTGLPAGTDVAFGVRPPAGVALSPGDCRTDATYRCSVTLTVATPPKVRTTYMVTADAHGVENTAAVTYGVR